MRRLRWLPALLGGSEVKGDVAAGTRRGVAGPNYVLRGVPYQINWDTERMVRDAYSRTLLVYRCIDAIASDECGLPLRRRRITSPEQLPEQGEIVEDRQLDRVWNRRANVFEGSDVHRYRISTLMFLSKQGVAVEKLRGRGGQVVGSVILPIGRTFPIPATNGKDFLDGWEVRMPDGAVEEIPAKDVIWFKQPHPTDPYSSMTPLEAMGLSVDMAFYARLFNRNFMANDGRPGGILSVRGDMDPDDAAELKARFQGGPGVAGRTSVIEADDISWVDTATTPRDAQYVQTLDRSDRDIMRGFGVHEGRLGDNSGRTFDNADADEENYWRTTMRNHCRAIGSTLDADPDYGGDPDDDEWIRHDMSSIAVLARQEHAQAARDMTEVEKGLMTPDQYIEKRGREPFGQPATQSLWIPQRAVVAPTPELQAEVDGNASAQGGTIEAEGDGQPAEAGVMPGQRQVGGAPAGDPSRAATPEGSPPLRLVKDASVPADFKAIMGEADRVEAAIEEQEARRAAVKSWLLGHEAELAAALVAYDRTQEQVVLGKLTGAKQRKGTRHWTPAEGEQPVEVKALPYGTIMATARWLKDAGDAVRPVIERLAAEQIERTAEELGMPATGLDLDDEVVERVVTQAISEVLSVAGKRMANIKALIEQADAAGEDLDGISKRVRTEYTKRRRWAESVARNAVAPTANAVGLVAATPLDDAFVYWLSSKDDSVRSSHMEADGQARPAGSDVPFAVGKTLMSRPGDRSAPIGEWINCRCTLRFERRPQAVG